jgi:hypothetical protein
MSLDPEEPIAADALVGDDLDAVRQFGRHLGWAVLGSPEVRVRWRSQQLHYLGSILERHAFESARYPTLPVLTTG